MIYLPHRRKAFRSTAYTAYGAVFDGTNDYMLRGSDLSGDADGKQLSISLWFNFGSGSDGSLMYLIANSDNYFGLSRSATNRIRLELNNQSAGYLYTSTDIPLAGTGWHHLAVAFDSDYVTTKSQIFIDGVDKLSNKTGAGGTIDFTRGNWSVCSYIDGASKLNASIAEVYVNLSTCLDFSSSTVLQKFRSSAGKPVSLGADGSLPTGTAPILYLKNPYDSFGTNSGTGGNFTVTGSLTDGGTI